MKKKIYTQEEIDKELENLDNFESDGFFTDIDGNIRDTEKEIEDYEHELLDGKVNFRMNKADILRCKRIASKKGLRYQSYIRSVVKQAMDLDEAG